MHEVLTGPWGSVLTPEEAALLKTAFEESWRSLAFAFEDDGAAGAATVRKQIARSLLSQHARGVRSRALLIANALADLAPMHATWAQHQSSEAPDDLSF